MDKIVLTVPEEFDGERADRFLSDSIDYLSRSAVQKLIENQMASVDGEAIRKSRVLKAEESVVLEIPDAVALDVEPEDIPLDIYYEDDDLLVVNKPKGMVVHPAPGNHSGTLVNALLYHCGESLSGINGVLRPGIVHRIDKDTSGLLLVAKNDLAHNSLAEQLRAHSVTRVYQAVVYGTNLPEEGEISAPIARNPKDRKKMAVVAGGREAVTHYSVIQRYRGFTHVACRLETGRTHQIRVHMAYIGHPVAGDPIYGPGNVIASLEGQCLHAGTLGFLHPRTGAYMEFEAPLPAYFTHFLGKLEEF
ncbi:MAG TPA: RluA family pseudouridine synthase [Oscillospiraceae bacterium]|nr:RluA family pseudouridine synthase [Oscillospiraceae bacterium]HNW05192.1 RluA family pseudouridine synthase [Oscillospiraceae bacterium]